jgi:hypothetical protein
MYTYIYIHLPIKQLINLPPLPPSHEHSIGVEHVPNTHKFNRKIYNRYIRRGTYMYIYIHECKYAYKCIDICVCMYVCMYIYEFTYIHTYIHTYIYIYIYKCVYIYKFKSIPNSYERVLRDGNRCVRIRDKASVYSNINEAFNLNFFLMSRCAIDLDTTMPCFELYTYLFIYT